MLSRDLSYLCCGCNACKVYGSNPQYDTKDKKNKNMMLQSERPDPAGAQRTRVSGERREVVVRSNTSDSGFPKIKTYSNFNKKVVTRK